MWYCIEIKVPYCVPNAAVDWWVNGQKQDSLTGLNLSSWNYWSGVSLGLMGTWKQSGSPCSSLKQTVYFDDLQISSIPIGQVQTTDLLSATVIDSNTVNMFFSDSLDNTADFPQNYAVSGGLSVISAVRSLGPESKLNRVTLKFNGNFQNNTEYTLTFNGACGNENKKQATFIGVNPTPIFSDDFNHPPEQYHLELRDKWDSISADTGCVVTTTESVKLHGAYSFIATDDNTNPGTHGVAFADKFLPELTTTYFRFYVYFHEGYFSQFDADSNGTQASIRNNLYIWDHDWNKCIYMQTARSSGKNILQLTESNDYTSQVSNIEPQENKWYCIEVKVPTCTVNASVEWWMEGQKQSSFTGLDLAAWRYWSGISLGLMGTWGYPGGAVCHELKQKVSFEDVAVSSNPLGMIYDTVAPAAVTSLSAQAGDKIGEINLSWLAPGDNGMDNSLPAGSSYLIKYSTLQVQENQWGSVNAQINISTSGVTPGTQIGRLVSGLSQSVTYYFRVWTVDGAQNRSGISSGAATQAKSEQVCFSDNFEGWDVSGIGSWDGRDDGAGIVSTTTVTSKAGMHCLECRDTSDTGNETGIYKNINVSGTTTYFRFYACLGQGYFDMAPWDREVLFYIYKAGWAKHINLSFIQNDSGGGSFRLANTINSSYVNASVTPETDKWYCFEIMVGTASASSTINWWIDGNAQPAYNIGDIRNFDKPKVIDMGLYLGTASSTHTVYFDELKISDTYIGSIQEDLVVPAAITSLSAQAGNSPGQVRLSWATPGNDGWQNMLQDGSKYRIQYASWTEGITWSTDSANGYSVEFGTANVVPETLVSRVITGLSTGCTYYFRVWTSDEKLNWSGISNEAAGYSPVGYGGCALITGPDPSFILGDVYSFPNPAKNRNNPTIHVEVGIADRLEIKIYNIAGEQIYKTYISGKEHMVVDGKYCYEYTWDSRETASGVYIYLVTAYKEGNGSLKSIKKLAIIK